MKGEIDGNFFCGTEDEPATTCPEFWWCRDGSYECCDKHRKWPTPEQFREEYGEERTGAVYTKCFSDFCKIPDCVYAAWSDFPQFDVPAGCDNITKVCACTQWGMPPDKWRQK